MSEEGDSDCEMEKLIHPTIVGQDPVNWFSEDVIEVNHYEE